VAARPAIVSVPEKPARAVGLSLTEESLGEILRYVLVYMPGTAALAGFVLLYRRRAMETRSRRENAGGGA
jgi:nitrate reductase gamma subunit